VKLAYAELVRAGQRSNRVPMSEIELRQLSLLRSELEEERSRAMRSTGAQMQMKTA
jgi:hypothetical protein